MCSYDGHVDYETMKRKTNCEKPALLTSELLFDIGIYHDRFFLFFLIFFRFYTYIPVEKCVC